MQSRRKNPLNDEALRPSARLLLAAASAAILMKRVPREVFAI
jgi:hypothetical protein